MHAKSTLNGQNFEILHDKLVENLIFKNILPIIKSHQFKTEVNEFAWNITSQVFVITTGGGKIQSFNFNDFIKSPLDMDMDNYLLDTFDAHSSNCICLKFDTKGDHFAVGSNDTLVSLWDANDFIPVRTYAENLQNF